jgi:hypothetical protein
MGVQATQELGAVPCRCAAAQRRHHPRWRAAGLALLKIRTLRSASMGQPVTVVAKRSPDAMSTPALAVHWSRYSLLVHAS